MIKQGFMVDHVWHFGCISKDFHNPFTSQDDPNAAAILKAQSLGPLFTCCGTESIDCSMM